jgi:hypothetical protein
MIRDREEKKRGERNHNVLCDPTSFRDLSQGHNPFLTQGVIVHFTPERDVLAHPFGAISRGAGTLN